MSASLVGSEMCIRDRPQSAFRHASDAKSFQGFEPGAVRDQERPERWSPKLANGVFYAGVRRDSESTAEVGDRG
eukprot:5995822-Alexandrium_andersonii.AAC.1